MLRKHLVVVGGGWAGLSLIRSLKNADPKQLRITLISDEPNFRYSPGLYRVATGSREQETIIPIGEVLEDFEHVEFILDSAQKIDRKNKTVKTESGKLLHYDFAVLGLGMVTSYFGIPGVEENSYNIKTVQGLRQFRAHIHTELTSEKALDKNYVVIGAGPTGVELAAALGSYLKRVSKWHGLDRTHVSIDLVDASPRILPSVPSKISNKVQSRLNRLGVKTMLNTRVESESDSTVIVNGKSIPTQTVVWTAGVSNNPFYKANASEFTFNDHNKVIVNERLMVDAHTYVIGDNAATLYSGLALTAVHNAQFVARDIKRRLAGNNALHRYKPLRPSTVIPVGKNWAAMQYRAIFLWGFIGSGVRNVADFAGYMDVLGFWKALEIWTKSGLEEEQCSVCKVQLSHQNNQEPLLDLR
jgi:NADH dehydrogenase